MKLCWLLGVLTIASCQGNDVIKENKAIAPTAASDGNGTVDNHKESPPGNKNLTKRQTGPDSDTVVPLDPPESQNREDTLWNADKRAKFSSWAGKRDPDDSKENKRARFSSWAGKRTLDDIGQFDIDKRAKFSSWAGKREYLTQMDNKRKLLEHFLGGLTQDLADDYDSTEDGNGNRDERIHEDKRTRFSSWGGKRSDASYENKRKFSSWSGKRGLFSNPYIELISHINPPNRSNYIQLNLDNNGLNTELYKLLKEGQSVDDYGDDIGTFWDTDADLNAEKRTRFSSWGGKRKFSSWGGKRSVSPADIQYQTDEIPDMEKRAKFSSWAGKRGSYPIPRSILQGKRGKFSSWAGKRSDITFDDITEEDKRGRFSSWGGKRDPSNSWDSYEDKRAKFSSWAGKRSDNENDGYYFDTDKRDPNWGMKKKTKGRGFSSWGGKRSFTDDEATETNDLDNWNDIKRANKFSSWAGKRSQDIDEEKRKFSSWGGKRDYSELIEDQKRAKFSSWAGKRSVDPKDGPELDKRKEDDKNVLLRRYNRFNSWRGKKDGVAILLNETEPTKLEDVDFNQTDGSSAGNISKRGFSNYYRQFEMIKRNPLFRAWIGKNYPDLGLMTWKRRPAFSSWGGKRSLTEETVGEMPITYPDDENDEKRTRFSNWGGKRDYHSVQKRSTKTTTQQLLQKLAPIKNPKNSKILGSRAGLEPHFYLRSSKDGLLTPALRPIRRQFYAWGGKRAQKS